MLFKFRVFDFFYNFVTHKGNNFSNNFGKVMDEKIKMSAERDEKYMRQALNEAERALSKREVPIGAVVVAGDRIIGRGHNLVETLMDATAHAEMQAITAAMSALGGKYLNDCTLYVTVEPCVMCGGALAWSQIGRVVYGAADEKRGYSTFSERIMHPKTQVVRGVLHEECEQLMRRFFADLRK